MKLLRLCLFHQFLLPLQFLLAFQFLLATAAYSADHGVILLYHHVSEATPPITSVTPAQFEQHLDYLQQHDYQIMPLERLLDNVFANQPLPDRAVAITFDDAYLSVFSEAAPRLQKLGWPFTVFLASQPLDDQLAGYMTWQQVRELLEMGGTIGGHSHTHDYLVRTKSGELWWQRNRRLQQEVDVNLQRIEEELGVKPTTFAYPFGEYNNRLKKLLKKRQLYGLAQQSGAVGNYTDPLQIPRFPMATGFADMQRFKVALQSRPLPVIEEQHRNTTFRFTLADETISNIGCYVASGEPLNIEKTDSTTYRVELPATQPGRNKINCTAPSGVGLDSFYWHSFLWLGETE